MPNNSESPGALVRREREARKLTQSELAKKVGTNQQTIGKIEEGTIKHSRVFPRLAAELGIALSRLMPDVAPEVAPIPESQLKGDVKNLPVHASAQGGQGELIVSSDPVDWVVRPAPLANVARGYGLIIVGESMAPEYETGDTALINPHLPPINGSTCVFYAEGNGEARATIKRLVRASDKLWYVQQWNPKRSFTLSRKEWGKCHRTVGKYNK